MLQKIEISNTGLLNFLFIKEAWNVSQFPKKY